MSASIPPFRGLQAKILICAFANLALLGLAVFFFVRVQFETGLESILLAPGQSRLRTLADDIGGALRESGGEDSAQVLAKYEASTGLRLALYENTGVYLGGSLKSLPEEVHKELTAGMRAGRPPEEGPPRPKKKDGKGPKKGAGRSEHPVFLIRPANEGGYWFGIRTPIPVPDHDAPVRGTLLARSASILLQPLLFDSRPWLFMALALSAITLACWIPLIRGLTLSVRGITSAAEQMSEGRFDVKIQTNRKDEMGHLSQALNRMASQLEGFVHGQKRFLGDIAHELSAPIARTRMALGILEERAQPDQRLYVDTVNEEVSHMSELVGELLHFSKAGLQTKPPDLMPLEIGNIVQKVLEREKPENGSVVRFVAGASLRVLGEPEGITRALSNVVRNAIRYAGAHGPITISAREELGRIVLTVSDNGPGLPEDALDKVFAPFYRLDTVRTPDSGGFGLGLSIVKACVEASGGTVSCHNRAPKGLEVVLRLQAASQAMEGV
ncbi:MAG: HAMP domain-containing histidine kinase [Candidatus Solibacter usitatus]|nr:HAMP domain-containing histidine kinase [Candidatus Solibacter usitatus]